MWGQAVARYFQINPWLPAVFESPEALSASRSHRAMSPWWRRDMKHHFPT